MYLRLSIWIVAAAVTVSCTRKQDSNSQISVELPPKVSNAQSAGQKGVAANGANDPVLAHVVINISGEGISPSILFTWDKNNSTTIPTVFSVPEPISRGTRLIQVLAVYQSPINDAMTFYYGDSTKQLSAEVEPVSIEIASLGGATPTIMGQISGRYFTSASNGPTGDLVIKFNTGNGKPKLTIERSTILNGWFSVFGLSSVALEYEVQAGMGSPSETLFGGSVNLMSPVFNPNESSGTEWNRRVRAALPRHVRRQSSNSNTYTYKSEEARYYVWGYWGNAAAKADASWNTRSVCRYSLSGSLNNVLRYHPIESNWPTQPGLNLSTLINIGLSLPSSQQLLDSTANSLAAVTFLGGSGNCESSAQPANTRYQTWMSVSPYLVNGNGNDNSAGFRGAFRFDANMNWITINGADPRVISGEMLPGVTSAVDEFRLYKKVASLSSSSDDSVDCSKITSSGQGFSAAGAASVGSNGRLNLTTNISASEAASGIAAILCPVKGGKLYSAGVFIHPSYFTGATSGLTNGPAIANNFAIEAPVLNGSRTYANGLCVPVRMVALDGSSTGAVFPTGFSATLSTTYSANMAIYMDSQCTIGTTSVTASGMTHRDFYVKSYLSSNASISLSAVSAGSLTLTRTLAFDVTNTPGTPVPKLYIKAPTTIYAHQCYIAEYETWHDNGGTPILIDQAANFSMSMPGFTFYNGTSLAGCTGSQQYYTYLGSSSGPLARVYFKYLGGETTVGLQPASGWNDAIEGGDNITVIQPGPVTGLALLARSLPEGNCTSLGVQTIDGNGNPSPVSTTTALTLTSSNGGTFYTNSYCSTSTTTVSLSASESSATVYFKSAVQGATTLSAANSSNSLVASSNISILPRVASTLLIELPGQSRSGLNINGTPNQQVVGQPFTIHIYAVTYTGTLDANYNGAMLTSLSGSGLTLPDPASVNFVNGVAITSATSNAPNPYVTINAYGRGYETTLSAYSGSFGVAPAATQFTLYMNYATNLIAGACQIAMLVPEDSAGLAGIPSDTTVNIAPGSGSFYVDKDCTTALGPTINMTIYDKYRVLFYRNPTPSTSGNITTSATGYSNSSLSFTVLAGGAVGASYRWQLLGKASPSQTVSNRCLPYVTYLADSGGMFSPNGSDISDLHVHMTSVGNTTGAFYSSSDCTSGLLDVTPISISSALGYRNVYSSTPASTGGGQQMNVSDYGAVYQSSYIQLYRSD